MKKLVIIFTLLVALCCCTTEADRNRMRSGLDSINQRNRNDQPFTVKDVEPYVHFFDDHGTPNDRLLAHYLLGRAYYEAGEAPMALECYQKAVECADTIREDCDYAQLGRVYAQMAEVFYNQQLYREQLKFDGKAICSAFKGKDTLSALMCYEQEYIAYKKLGLTDSAIFVIEDVAKLYDNYSEVVLEYMRNGGIRKLERYGKKSGTTYGKIDNLRMYYHGMQVDSVKEDALPLTYTGAFDFVSKTIPTSGVQYSYYDDGSLRWDANKGVTRIDYSRFGYPERVQFHNGNVTEYAYTPDGEKHRVIYRTAVPNISVSLGQIKNLNSSNTLSVDSINYVGDFLFENGQLSKFLFEGGYATIANGQPTYHYFTKDHLGNNRAVVNHNGTIEQVVHYYPFGAVYSDAGTADALQRYKYNGKELDRMHGLNQYDYGARNYDPLMCRFTQMDPMAEKYYNVSPYVYCENDPVNAIDPDGRSGLKLLIKGTYKVGKVVAKNGLSSLVKSATYTVAFNDVVDDAKTIFDSNVSTLERAVAGVSLLSEIASPVSIKDAKNIGKAAKGLTKDYSKIGSTGKVGEEALKKLGGKSQQTFDTSKGKRIVDQFSDGVAHESKVGYQSLTKGIKSQIQKDAELIKRKEIDGAIWHFFQSPVTGKGGPSKPLMDELRRNDIKVEIHE